jgi:hypothetical protein
MFQGPLTSASIADATAADFMVGAKLYITQCDIMPHAYSILQ